MPKWISHIMQCQWWLAGWLVGWCVQCMHIGKVSHPMDVIIVHGRILYAKRKNDLLFGWYKSNIVCMVTFFCGGIILHHPCMHALCVCVHALNVESLFDHMICVTACDHEHIVLQCTQIISEMAFYKTDFAYSSFFLSQLFFFSAFFCVLCLFYIISMNR